MLFNVYHFTLNYVLLEHVEHLHDTLYNCYKI